MRLEEIPIDLIRPNVGNVRRDIGNVTELAASIKARGILEPLVVACSEQDDSYTLIAGHRRLEAAKKAKLTTAPCRVLDAMTRAEELELMLVENLQRSDLTPVEEGEAYQQLLLEGVDVDEIRKTTGRSATTIRSRLKILDLPGDTVERVHKGQLSLDAALKLAQFTDEPAQLERLAGLLDSGSHSNFPYYLKQAKERVVGIKAAQEAGAVVYTDRATMNEAHPHLESQPHGTKPGPGLVVYFDLYAGRIPSMVAKALDHEPTEEEIDEVAEARSRRLEQEQRDREDRREQLRVAQELRLDFVRDLLPQKKLRPAAVLNGFRQAVLSLAPANVLLPLLGFEAPRGFVSAEDVEKARPETDRMELPNLIVLATAAHLATAASRALNDTQDSWTQIPNLRAGVAWFDFLVSHGYELNDLDAAKLAEIEARIALLEGK